MVNEKYDKSRSRTKRPREFNGEEIVHTTINIDRKVLRDFKAQCALHGVYMSDAITRAILSFKWDDDVR